MDWVLVNHQARVNNLSHTDGDLDWVPPWAYRVWVQEKINKRQTNKQTMASASASVWEKSVLPALDPKKARQFSFFLYVPHTF